MRSQGNGNPSVCVNNLLKCVRTEIPYQRTKGLNPRLIDSTPGASFVDVKQDAELVVEIFEKRVKLNAIHVSVDDTINGGFTVTADVTEKGG